MNITAIIPSYNHGAYVGQAVRSVLAQTRPVQEIIVVDDGSTDNTRQVVAEFGGPVRYLYQENRGLAAARNTGIRAAQGDWVAFLDADDRWEPEKIQLQGEALQADPKAVLCYTSVLNIFPDGPQVVAPATAPERLWPELRFRNCVTGSGSSVCVRKDVVLEAGGFLETLTACEDWELWVRLARKYRFTAVVRPVTVYRVLPASMSTNIEKMLANTERILESTLLEGLSGWRRAVWRRRIRSWQLCSAAWIVRRTDPRKERELIWRSLRQWPSPFFVPRRYAYALYRLLGISRGEV